jgi:hypothetical protein
MIAGRSLVDWGGVSRRQSNEFVTVDALAVLTAAGRHFPPAIHATDAQTRLEGTA